MGSNCRLIEENKITPLSKLLNKHGERGRERERVPYRRDEVKRERREI